MPSRTLIIERLAAADGHLSAAQIYRDRGAEHTGIHLGTIHRGLDTLQRHGVVHVVDDRGTARYGLTVPPHLHAVCDECGTLVDVEVEELQPVIDQLAATAGFTVAVDGVVLRGRCRDCAR